MDNKPHTIYALYDPRSPESIRYIGFSNDCEFRLRAHVWEAIRTDTESEKLRWLRSLLADDIEPGMRAIETVTGRYAAGICEQFHIASCRRDGHDLTNGTAGGDSYATWDDVRTAKHGERMARYWARFETREQQRAAMKAWWASPEAATAREGMRRKNSEMAKRQHARPDAPIRSKETRAKMSQAKLGKPHARQRTPEWNAKISAAQKGIKRRPWTDEERERHMNAMNHEQMSASAKARWRRELSQQALANATAMVKKMLQRHCEDADAEGMSALCECRVCLDARACLAVAS